MTQIKSSSIAPTALLEKLDARRDYELLDVRTPPEYGSGHVPGARLVPLSELKADALLAQHLQGTPIYVLCQTGSRAAKAIEKFEREGCNDCVLVEGGTQAWIDEGLPVHRRARKVLPLMQQVQVVIGSLNVIGGVLALLVQRWFLVVPLLLGCGLLFAGITGTCGMALLLARMPWNSGEGRCSLCNGTE